MSTELRGYVSRIRRFVITTAGREVRPKSRTARLRILNEGANVVRLYLTQQDFTNDVEFIVLAASGGLFDEKIEVGGATNGETPVYFLRSLVGDSTVVTLEQYLRS